MKRCKAQKERTDTTPYTKALRYKSDLRLGGDLDAKLAGPNNGT